MNLMMKISRKQVNELDGKSVKNYLSLKLNPLWCLMKSFVWVDYPCLNFEIFSLFFGQYGWSMVEQTNLYATKDKNVHYFEPNHIEMRKFLGMIIISGYNRLPSENNYRSTTEDLRTPIFLSIMSRSRFKTLKRYLHISDNRSLSQK